MALSSCGIRLRRAAGESAIWRPRDPSSKMKAEARPNGNDPEMAASHERRFQPSAALSCDSQSDLRLSA